MTKKKHILITNDDGIEAPGLRFLWEALVDVADITIVAPASEQSGVGLSLTLRTPIHIEPVKWERNTKAWKVSGTPADCIRMASSVLLKQKPDLIVSGINKGSNAGRNVLYSGTIGGVIEGVLRNIPGIAFSCVDFENPDYKQALPHIFPLVRYLFEHPIEQGSFLNVNFPQTAQIRGIKLASQGLGYWIEDPDARVHPEGRTYYWHGGKWDHHEEKIDSDVHLLNEGYATAVPIKISELTDLALLESRKQAFDNHFTS
jgi:5'-nucleotidase